MSLLPYFLDEFGIRRPRRIVNQHFGLGLSPDDILSAVIAPSLQELHPMHHGDYYRPWRHMASAARDIGSSIKADKDKFQISLDVQHFSPEEISVKTADGHIVVEGKHEERKDEHGFISRQFTRRYALPEGAAAESVESRLSSDGVLTITAPRRPPALAGERAVPITHTGPVRKEIKDHANDVGDKKENSK